MFKAMYFTGYKSYELQIFNEHAPEVTYLKNL